MSVDLDKETQRLIEHEIDAMIAQAIGSLERGEGVDGEKFFADLENEERKLQRQRE